MKWNFENSYLTLPPEFYSETSPEKVSHPELVLLNGELAKELGLDGESLTKQIDFLCGNKIPRGASPLCQAYAGHQFGHFNILGDGRAHLLGEHRTPQGKIFDIQLKGSGRSPYSRRGDGRAALGPMLREYILSEAMHHLGIPTTRSLAVVQSGEKVYRETELPGAILLRVASSHIRIGTFEYAARIGDLGKLQAFVDYVIRRHDPDVLLFENPVLEFLNRVIDRQAQLVARWMNVGFVHGVMNTDNVTVSGETIDYGPCAFMDAFDLQTVFSSIDQKGRYAYGNQPGIMNWNLARLAETLMPLLDKNPDKALQLATQALEGFAEKFNGHWSRGLRLKLGLVTEKAKDHKLVNTLLSLLEKTRADFTNTFRDLVCELQGQELSPQSALRESVEFQSWLHDWKIRLSEELEGVDKVLSVMRAHNPNVIPRNQWVEEALAAAVERSDYQPLNNLNALLEKPYDYDVKFSKYHLPAGGSFRDYKTFCGT